ncbi:aldehyde dehydrogenase family protein [Chryseobacterium gossypii]|uniref:aldehyde dehydrogenase family protein n=1 Tax=Chryseobacterium gossypii TaxID=3231602 RepID=UPI0035241657
MDSFTSTDIIDKTVKQTHQAYLQYKNRNVKERSDLLLAIAHAIENTDEEIISIAHEETNISKETLRAEKEWLVEAWRANADALLKGYILDIRIDTELYFGDQTNYNLRTIGKGVGVVAVFGASNWPFAFSTAGVDTSSAFAAGCAVIVKAHPAHPKTSVYMEKVVKAALEKEGYPKELFGQIFSNGNEGGQFLVRHELVKAIGFTGSIPGGRAIFDIASKRPEPIPVFAEMGSVNPVFVLQDYWKKNTAAFARTFKDFLVDKAGQYCTNNGVLIVPDTEELNVFATALQNELKDTEPQALLTEKIAESFRKGKMAALDISQVEVLAKGKPGDGISVESIVLKTDVPTFLAHENLSEEVFGTFSIVVTYKDQDELNALSRHFVNQLTACIFGEESDLQNNQELIETVSNRVGRLMLNNFSNGIQPLYATHHGGGYPATSDSRFTAVGPYSIRRFLKPITYQNWDLNFLPMELQNENPLGLWRVVNGAPTTEDIK